METKVTNKQLRSFGLMVGGIFAVIGMWPLVFRGEDPRLWALGLTLALVLPGLIYPRVLGPIFKVWMAIGLVLGWINTRIILGVIFYLLITPMGLVMRLMGKDPLHRRIDAGVDTYRVPKQARPGDHVKRQF